VLVPANRFEVLECRAAIDAIAENAQDTPPLRIGALDVLAQHVLGCACGEPFLSDQLYGEVLTAAPYSGLSRIDFDDVVDFVATGGYALKTYERFARIKQDKNGRWRVANPLTRQSYRLNVGTIVEETMLKVRLVRSRGGGSGSTGALGRGGRSDRLRRAREHDEQRVAVDPDLEAVDERGPQRPGVDLQDVVVSIGPEGDAELRRALDGREEEGERATRQWRAPHDRSVASA